MLNKNTPARHLFRQVFSSFLSGDDRAAAASSTGLQPGQLTFQDTASRHQTQSSGLSAKDATKDQLIVPICEPTQDTNSGALQDQGQFLARQDRWSELSTHIAEADKARHNTPHGLPVAELLAHGARSDVVNAVEHALSLGHAGDRRKMIEGVMGLEAMCVEHRDDPYLRTLVALAHIDVAWIWRGYSDVLSITVANGQRCAAHFDRAAALLHPLDGIALDSPFIAAAKTALLAGQRSAGTTQVADDFAALIDLDPNNHRPMRSLGTHMLPRWFGSYSALELEARRTAVRTQAIWGDGGYTWVYFDAIALDPEACARVDIDFFMDGLRDIVSRQPDQEMINLLASYCAVALRYGEDAPENASPQRSEIAEAADWLIRDHLREIHPLIWAHATQRFDNNLRVTSARRFADHGRRDALRFIAGLFRHEIEAGQRVEFSAKGLRVSPD
ncbi:hypothetical protein [Phaeobacter gallaeciensis]|uniref:hypothetical protein n=1 Tax=Phaeobacter gallaeciensis TaxID=60890 RepID=UPI000BC00FAC|nr:hypothetical protein PhaeoP129_02351 [Phaeobacter gallaeciensis]ATF23082.1 hypothetical protein PhaeoP128_02351 [Phaeobacter gallaeciensis]